MAASIVASSVPPGAGAPGHRRHRRRRRHGRHRRQRGIIEVTSVANSGRSGMVTASVSGLALAQHREVQLLARLVGTQDAQRVRAVLGLAPVDGLDHVAIFELEGGVLRRLHHEHAVGRAEIRAELRRDARELHAAELAGQEACGTAGPSASRRHAAHDAAIAPPSGHAHVEHAVIERHRTRHHHVVLVLAVAQHAHLHLLLGLHLAHVLDQRAVGLSPPAMVLPSSATMTSLSRRPASAAGPPGLTLSTRAPSLSLPDRSARRAPRGAARRLMNTDVVARVARRAASDSSATSRAALSSRARASSSLARVFASSASRLASRRPPRFASRRARPSVPGDCATPRRSRPTNKPASTVS